ncbi:putative stress-induced protein [Legionella lansingensis]|uniref:Putative stress-induced protein n=1 Tax=Legionella lansingensis TaxID=45067 RepID=A0A0W0V6Z6_9GAMM|nr:YicC/YloC family endoribonuclease [Legionella lansingensis]KTD15888.1 putative stress-induced protein [Legionella lansingensis]SNV47624.1 putative stress-induced protein [Legionella lansingensis]
MTHSMTAFARVEHQLDVGIFCWEIKSVNHRYLDVSFRLPEMFRFLEPALRSLMRGKISRGKLECQLKFHDAMNSNQSMLVNEPLVNDLIATGNKVAASHMIANDLSLSTILAWPGVLEITKPDIDMLGQQAEKLFEEALMQLLTTRQVEGNALNAQITLRLEKLSEEVNKCAKYITSYNEQLRDKLVTRLQNLQLEVDNARLEQELALLIARADVSEELDRLNIHVQEVANTLKSGETAVGRRLDFLMQELNREANTLSSKSDAIALTQSAIEMKVLIEQMREQIQNIE